MTTRGFFAVIYAPCDNIAASFSSVSPRAAAFSP